MGSYMITPVPSVRVQSLHALAYCERLFYLEEVENVRLADAAVYAGRRLHVELERDEEGEWHTLELQSEQLGLRGRVDCLRRRDGSLIPYEHKRERAARIPHSARLRTAASVFALSLPAWTGRGGEAALGIRASAGRGRRPAICRALFGVRRAGQRAQP